MADHWMQSAFGKNPGALHRQLNVPEGQPIPQAKLDKASHSSDPTTRKRVALAEVGKKISRRRYKVNS